VPGDAEHQAGREDAAGDAGGLPPADARGSGLGGVDPAPSRLPAAAADVDQRPDRDLGLRDVGAGEVTELADDGADAVPLRAGGLALVDRGKLEKRGRLLLALVPAVDEPHHVTEAVAAEARPAIPGGGELLRRGELGGEVEDLLEIVGLIRGSLRIDHRSVSPETVRAA